MVRLTMARLSLALLALTLACGGVPPAQPGNATEHTNSDPSATPTDADDLSVLEGHDTITVVNKEGVRVVLVPVRSESEPTQKGLFLFRATGTDSPFDGLVLRVRRSVVDFRQVFMAHLRGEPFGVLVHKKGGDTWRLLGYEYSDEPTNLQHVDQPVDVDLLLQLGKTQRESGEVKIETTDRKEMEGWQNARLEESVGEIEGACSGVNISIDWSQVTDEMFFKERIAAECTGLIASVEEFCKQHSLAAEKLLTDRSFVCAYRGDADNKENFLLEKSPSGVYVYSPGGGNERLSQILHFLRETTGETEQVYRLGKRLFIMRFRETGVKVFSGTDDVFYPVASASDPRPSSIGVNWEPVQGSLSLSPGDASWSLQCHYDRQKMETLVGNERQAVLERAKYEKERKWKRMPYSLSRDMRGTYYYVDRYRPAYGGKRYRVFVGRRGQLKLTKLKGVVEDAQGTLFATDSGQLRLVVNKAPKTATWIRGKKKTVLTPVNIGSSGKLIYDELGVYFSDDLGFICE